MAVTLSADQQFKMVTETGSKMQGTIEFRGLSTDTKPTDCINGAAFIEIDTGKVFLFDAVGQRWNEV